MLGFTLISLLWQAYPGETGDRRILGRLEIICS